MPSKSVAKSDEAEADGKSADSQEKVNCIEHGGAFIVVSRSSIHFGA